MMKQSKRRSTVLTSLLCQMWFILMVFPLYAQIHDDPAKFILHADYSRFWKNDSLVYLEISTQIYSNMTTLRRDSAGFHGNVRLNISIRNTNDTSYIISDEFLVPIEHTDSLSLGKNKMLVHKSIYTVGCGSYSVFVSARDDASANRHDSSKFIVEVTKRSSGVAVSDAELCSSISESMDQKDVFYKNTYRVVPNPNRVFGPGTVPLLYTYVETYNLDPSGMYIISGELKDLRGQIKKNRTVRRRFSQPNVVDVFQLNTNAVPSGKYDFVYSICDTLGHELARTQRQVFINNPNITDTTGSLSLVGTDEFGGMSIDEIRKEFRTAVYIARPDDRASFDKLTTVEARREFLRKFWKRVESETTGQSVLTRSEYLNRVAQTNERYRTPMKEGWRTDRGRVFILYGEPNEIERNPFPEDSKPYEIWFYRLLESGVKFVFIDNTFFNDFVLVHSTKQGEIKNEAWQDLLKKYESLMKE
jgi:GWxTD domain-containing protein